MPTKFLAVCQLVIQMNLENTNKSKNSGPIKSVHIALSICSQWQLKNLLKELLFQTNISIVNRMLDELKMKEKFIGWHFRQSFLISRKVVTRRYKESISIKSTATFFLFTLQSW